MHSLVLPRDSTPMDERRRHIRHSLLIPSKTVVVELGPNNGGNLIDIGAGGLSLQAVARLRPEAELTLRFRLQGMQQAIEVAGRVMWLGPTQKVAGISFKNLPSSTEQQIVEWVARQEGSTHIDPSDESDDSPLPPFPVSLYRFKEPESDPLPPPLPPFPISLYRPQERLVLPLRESIEPLAEHSEPLPDTFTLSKYATMLPPGRPILLDLSLIPPTEISSAGVRVNELSASESRRRRRKVALAVVVAVLGILVLFAVAPQSSEWVSRLKAFAGMGVPAKMDPAKAGVLVWTVPHNGFYYCADDPNFQALLPGAIMTQGEALQNAYKPRLGYCK
jgi:hypothetical protein